MSKYYFEIHGINAELENEEAAEAMCLQIEKILQKIGVKEADVFYSTEEDYLKEMA